MPENTPAVFAGLGTVSAVAVDSADNVFMALTDYNVVVKLDVASGNLTRVAGNGKAGFSGDGGAAIDAQLNFPFGIAIDSAGNLYIADAGNNRVRRVSNGIITTVAGNGSRGFSGDDGPAVDTLN